jgi:hypothetical protein
MPRLCRILVPALVLFGGCHALPSHEASVTFLNNSGEEIRNLDVAVSGERLHASSLAPSSLTTLRFTPGAGSGYTIDAELSSGRRLHVDDIGYVSTGLTINDRFEITEDGIYDLSTPEASRLNSSISTVPVTNR